MFRYFSLIRSIGCIVIVVLIDDGDRFRISFRIADDIEKDSDMFARGICESIVRLGIEICNHESLIR
jgi:hypothetical protein